jgi:dihydropteroate synthase
MAIWRTTRFAIDLGQPQVMGIVNVTPDSFADGGRHADTAGAMAHCDALLREGAQILDIGGESTRPGAHVPSAEEELRRIEPVLRHALTLGVPVSVDTSQPLVMRAALDLGVDIVNDVRALRREGALDVLAGHPSAGVCLMHMQGEPGTMQGAPHYGDVVAEVAAFLAGRRKALCAQRITADRIVLDPGIGFGKTVAHNLALLQRQRELLALGAPLLVGWSRKSTLGAVTGRAVNERLAASIVAALLAVQRGASIVRVHDVAATIDALALWRAVGNDNEAGQR